MTLGREKFEKRFFSKILITESGCWEWQGSKTKFGYGKCKYFGEQLAHRVSFILHQGPLLGSEMCVLHRCDNPPCVNPSHLFVGTTDTNNKDRAAKKRNNHRNELKTHCKRGHEFDEINTVVRGINKRSCRICVNMMSLKAHHRRKAQK